MTSLTMARARSERVLKSGGPEDEEGALKWLTDACDRAKREGPYSAVVDLTPALARVLVSLNPENRTVRLNLLQQITRDIKDDNYLLNGEPIIVSDEGVMNDGQHRCLAVIETETSIRTFMAFGLSRESRLTVDTGAARTPGDFLTMSGIKNANVCSGCAALLWQWETTKTIRPGQLHRATKAQGQAKFWEHKEEIERIATMVTGNSNMVFGSRVCAAFAVLILSRIDREQAEEFLTTIRSGANLQVGDPRLVARERLRTEKGNMFRKIELLFRAWNYWREGKTSVRSIPIINNVPQPK